MRYYALSQVQSREAYGRFTWIARVLQNWRNRGDLKKIRSMDDYMLRDLGLTRDIVAHLSNMPLSANVDWELERLQRLK